MMQNPQMRAQFEQMMGGGGMPGMPGAGAAAAPDKPKVG